MEYLSPCCGYLPSVFSSMLLLAFLLLMGSCCCWLSFSSLCLHSYWHRFCCWRPCYAGVPIVFNILADIYIYAVARSFCCWHPFVTGVSTVVDDLSVVCVPAVTGLSYLFGINAVLLLPAVFDIFSLPGFLPFFVPLLLLTSLICLASLLFLAFMLLSGLLFERLLIKGAWKEKFEQNLYSLQNVLRGAKNPFFTNVR